MDQLFEFLHRAWNWMKVNHLVFPGLGTMFLVLWIVPLLRKHRERVHKVWRFCRRFPGNSVAMPPALASSALCFAASIWRDRTLFQAQLLVACASSIYLAYCFLRLAKRGEREMEEEIKIWKSPDCAELDRELIESEIAGCRAAHQPPKRRCEVWMWIMAGTALLFNPVFPLHFTRHEWVWIDIIAGVVFLLSLGLSGGFYRVSPESETSGTDAPSSK